MQQEAFRDLLHKYQDYDTNPDNEPLDKVIDRIKQVENTGKIEKVNDKLTLVFYEK